MVFEKILKLMAEKQASDVFVSIGAPIQIKIQGQSMPINQQIMDTETILKIAHELMNPDQFTQLERTNELTMTYSQSELGNFRITAFRQRRSIALSIRYIQNEIPTLKGLNLPPALAEVSLAKHGLVLVAGASGSGKSNTLAALIYHRSLNRAGHILTIENPIEFQFRHAKSIVNQREIGIDANSWQEALQNVTRQAPDCLMLGEIKDHYTMKAALDFTQSGQLCMATINASNGVQALNRVLNFFPQENRSIALIDLAAALKCVISQRLVRKSNGTRVPAVEILMNSKHIAGLIERGELNAIKEAMDKSMSPDSQTFEQALYDLYTDNVIELQEALSNADSSTNLSWLINNGKAQPELSPPELLITAEKMAGLEEAEPDGASFKEFSLRIED